MRILTTLFLLNIFWFNAVAAPVTIYKFDSKENEAIFYKLTDEIRCLVCQNQNIAESNSELAQDLKRQIHTMLQQGKTEEEIVAFMVERFGDYVLFDPPFKPLTWLLWFGPAIIFLIALTVVIRAIARQEKTLPGEKNNKVDAARLDELKSELQQTSNKDK